MVGRCRYLQAEAHQAGITPPKLQSSKLSSALPHALWMACVSHFTGQYLATLYTTKPVAPRHHPTLLSYIKPWRLSPSPQGHPKPRSPLLEPLSRPHPDHLLPQQKTTTHLPSHQSTHSPRFSPFNRTLPLSPHSSSRGAP